jgi:signal transduction histidine kinase/FixJ family two-component response regulator
MLRNYDIIVREQSAIDAALGQLREAVAWDAAEDKVIDQLAASVARQTELIEQFKSDNALLQNSMAYFGMFSSRIGGSDGDRSLFPQVSALGAAMLRLTLDPSTALAKEVENHLNDLAAQAVPSNDTGPIRGLLEHGRLLHDLLPSTNAVLKDLLAVPVVRDEAAVRAMVQTHRQAARDSARQFRFWLYAISLLPLALLIHLGLQVRQRARALQRRAAFEHAIAGISTGFINAPPNEVGARVELALAQLSDCVGADRAYFVLAASPARTHTWLRPGNSFPPAWPEQALALAGRMERTKEGILYVQRVAGLTAGQDRDLLVAAGVRGWACILRTQDETVDCVLGFDALGRRLTGEGAELGLLRMALDAIANALNREFLEGERTRLEARLQRARRMETMGAFASGIAHNFNNIVGAILGHAEIVQVRLASDRWSAANIDAIRRAGERGLDLVEQILTFGRCRDARRRPINLTSLVTETVSFLAPTLPTRIEIAVNATSDAAVVSGEPAQLQQVIINLCNNAVQAIDDAGHIAITIEVHHFREVHLLSHQAALAPDQYVCIAVTDDGRGIDEATLQQIFEPFFTTRLAGNGLGLATVREIVREHGGAMNVWSAPSIGSRFEAWLPRAAATAAPPGDDSSALPIGHGETLLLVDDERERLLRNEEILAALGYEPVGYMTALEALVAYRANPTRFDAIVVEHHMLAESAAELAAALHDTASKLPILLVAASADDINTQVLASTPIAEFVHRPFRSSEIAAALKRSLSVPATSSNPLSRQEHQRRCEQPLLNSSSSTSNESEEMTLNHNGDQHATVEQVTENMHDRRRPFG